MPSDFSYLPPASHALQFIVCYQQFTIMMFFTSLLISLPYSSMRVTSGDGNSLILLKLFILCFDSRGQFDPVHHSSAPQVERIPRKPVNSFIFVCSRWCKNSSPAFSLAYKSTAAFASTLFTEHTAKAVVNCCKVHATSFVSVVSRLLLHSLFNTN